MSKCETEAVIVELTKQAKKRKPMCRLKPVASGSSVEIGGKNYLVGRGEKKHPKKARGDTKLWRLTSAGTTKTEFRVDHTLRRWALAAWQCQRKVHLEIKGNCITNITLL